MQGKSGFGREIKVGLFGHWRGAGGGVGFGIGISRGLLGCGRFVGAEIPARERIDVESVAGRVLWKQKWKTQPALASARGNDLSSQYRSNVTLVSSISHGLFGVYSSITQVEFGERVNRCESSGFRGAHELRKVRPQ